MNKPTYEELEAEVQFYRRREPFHASEWIKAEAVRQRVFELELEVERLHLLLDYYEQTEEA